VVHGRQTHADLTKHGLTSKSFDEAFKDLDSDESGHITYNEYIQWLIRIGSLKLKPID
jgi:Ca2+-binding EF-hand superfamily protein